MRVPFSRVTLALGAVGLIVGSVSPAQTAEPTKDIVTTAVDAGSFNTLAKALAAAGLVETLKGPGPFTVFAATDEAFANLPPGTLEALLADQAKRPSPAGTTARAADAGATMSSCSRRGRPAAPAIRSSTRGCASSRHRDGYTIARGCSPHRSS